MSKRLPQRPSLEHLRSQAKQLCSSFRSGDSDAVKRFAETLPAVAGKPLAQIPERSLGLHDAQSVVAREYGFKSWPEMVREVERLRALAGITKEVAEDFVARALSDRPERCERLLELYPGLPKFRPVTALVCGDVAFVNRWLGEAGKEAVTAKLGPNNWQPLEYVCYSGLHRLGDGYKYGLFEIAETLLLAGADPNTAHSWREDRNEPLSVLHGAAGHTGNESIVRLLLHHGANPNDGESIYHAAEHDRTEILELLLASGVEISARTEPWGNTPIFFLAGYRPTDPGWATAMRGIRWLLDHGADPNVRCQNDQETALHCACRTGNGDLVSTLLGFGADPQLERADGMTPFELAAVTGNSGVMQALTLANGVSSLDDYEKLLAACAEDDLPSAQLLVSNDPAVRERLTSEGGRAMVKVAELGVTAGVRNLLALGCDVASRGEGGATALHFACFCGWADCVDVLLAHGAPLDVEEDEYHATPLGWAIQATGWHRSPTGDYVRIVRALLAAGGDKNHLRGVMEESDDHAERLAELKPLLEG